MQVFYFIFVVFPSILLYRMEKLVSVEINKYIYFCIPHAMFSDDDEFSSEIPMESNGKWTTNSYRASCVAVRPSRNTPQRATTTTAMAEKSHAHAHQWHAQWRVRKILLCIRLNWVFNDFISILFLASGFFLARVYFHGNAIVRYVRRFFFPISIELRSVAFRARDEW